jgi:protein SCO1/2
MIKDYTMRAFIIGLLLSLSPQTFADPALPDDSIYQVGGTWQTENNQMIQLASLAGKPQLIALIFTGCSNACPIIVESMKRVENKIPMKLRSQMGFVLVSLTPETDTQKSLKVFAEKKGLNPNWKILRGNDELVRTLSNALNGRYKVIKDGDVAHSNTVTLLNGQGQIQAQASGTVSGIKSILEVVEQKYPSTALDTKRL